MVEQGSEPTTTFPPAEPVVLTPVQYYLPNTQMAVMRGDEWELQVWWEQRREKFCSCAVKGVSWRGERRACRESWSVMGLSLERSSAPGAQGKGMRLGPRMNKSEEMVQCMLGRLIKALLVIRCICLMSLGSLEEGSLRPSLSIGGLKHVSGALSLSLALLGFTLQILLIYQPRGKTISCP